MLDKLVRNGLQILVHERQHAGCSEQHHQALEGLEDSDDPDCTFQRERWFGCAA